jgi:hypothetical protein
MLKDPFSGRLVEVRTAELSQDCPICGRPMLDRTIFRVEGHAGNWRCALHLEDTLMVMDAIRREEETT